MRNAYISSQSLNLQAMGLANLLQVLGEEIQDPEEESFLLFAQADRSSNLGFVDSQERRIEISVAGQDLVIEQSPSLLRSDRATGTTGAVLWKVTPLFADWMASECNVFVKNGLLGPSSTVLELGCGVSGVVALAMSKQVARFIVTDQEYVFKMLKSNLNENAIRLKSGNNLTQCRAKSKQNSNMDPTSPSNIEILALDWETSSISLLPSLLGSVSPLASPEIDAVVACDCIYNEALIDPFVQTCVDICRLPKSSPVLSPTICIIAQQLRSHIVFETWLQAFHKEFRVWRIPDHLLDATLSDGSGFVVHVAILREVAN